MPTKPVNIKKSSLNVVEQYELNQWLEENQINSSNLRRSFTDVLPLARLLSRYYPELIDLNYYPPRNSVQNKLYNWESFNKRVLSKLGLHLTREQMLRVARSVPGSVDLLLYSVMQVHQAAVKAHEEHTTTEDYDEDDDEGNDETNAEPNEIATKAESLPPDETKSSIMMTVKSMTAPATLALQLSKQKKDTAQPDQLAVSHTSGLLGTPLPPGMKRARGNAMAGAPPATAAAAAAVAAASGATRQKKQSRTTGAGQRAAAGSSPGTASTTSAAAASRHRGEQQQQPQQQQPQQQQQQQNEPQRTVLYSIYMQAVNQLRQKDAQIDRIDQWTAHLENMLQLKCDRIDELQCQVAQASGDARGRPKQLKQRQGGTRTRTRTQALARTRGRAQMQGRTRTPLVSRAQKRAAGNASPIFSSGERFFNAHTHTAVRPPFRLAVRPEA